MPDMFSELLEEKYICPVLIEKVKEYFTDSQNRKTFEEWYRKRYGKEYKWSDTNE